MKHYFFLYFISTLHLFISLTSLVGGGMLMLKPDGSLLGMETEWLNESPFENYLIPGFILFTLNGILPMITFIGLLLKPKWDFANLFNIYPNRYWAWTYSLYIGIITIMWIIMQQMMTQYFWVQPVIVFIGLLIIVCTMLPSVMKEYESRD